MLVTKLDCEGDVVHKLLGRYFKAEAVFACGTWYIEAGQFWMELDDEGEVIDLLHELFFSTPATTWRRSGWL